MFLDETNLQGITFYIKEPERTKILMGQKELKVTKNAKDDTGQYSVSIPVIPLNREVILKLCQARTNEQ